LATALLVLPFTAHAATPQIRYRFEPAFGKDHCSFHIVVTLRAQKQLTTLAIPTTFGNASHLETQFQHLTSQTASATLMDGASPGEKQLKARPGSWVTFSYDLASSNSGRFREPAEHRAVLDPEYFLFNPQNALISPEFSDNEMVKATFDWRMLPPGMPFFSSFGDGNRLQKVSAPWFRIENAIFAGGKFRVLRSTQSGHMLILAMRGQWSFTDAEVFAQIRKIVDTENNFWHTAPLPYYLVTLAQFDEDEGDNDGSAFTNAYMLFLSRKDTFDAGRIMLIAHEVFHHWNPDSMGPVNDSVQWFYEGFTYYYQGVIPLRFGLISYADYLKSLNEHLSEYELLPLHDISNAAWLEVDHTSGTGYLLSYARGAAIALWADARLREHTAGKSSLDNVLFDLVNPVRRGSNPPPLTAERIFAAFQPYLSTDDLAKLRSFALDGAAVPLPARLGACAHLELTSMPSIDLGFDEASLKDKKLAHVKPGSPAYRAGLRDGQQVYAWSYYNNDPSKEVMIGLVTATGKREIRYLPDAKRGEQYRQNTNSDASPACTPFDMGLLRRPHSRLISDAIHAAPNPLSILTTETLGAQVFSMPSSAATPPSEAP